jgi:AAA+ ATPase superfamily predicted ATPase
MLEKIIGREEERAMLEKLLNSKQAEFLAIYGRRRVGKTMLIRGFFKEKKGIIFLNTTGTLQGSMRDQIDNFTQQVGAAFYQGAQLKNGKNWNETFKTLNDAIKSVSSIKKIVLFFDEFPWMATKNSKLLQNLDYYWNQHWSNDNRIKLIICGSSASWIIKKIINNKGGLHNRITRTIHLEPYNLRDTKRFLNYRGVKLNNQQVAQLYMAIGGIPYYLSYVEKGLSAAQNLENLAFRRKSFLLEEFNNLFSALFEDADIYINIVRTIARNRYGIEQEELFSSIRDLSKGGRGTDKLKALEDASFIMRFKPHLHSRKGIYYKVIDEYTLFYFHWIDPLKESLLTRGMKKNYWDSIQSTPEWYSWSGYAFEAICYKHVFQISEALNMSPTALTSTWKYTPTKNTKENGAQIDLLFDRKDNAITLCEIKYTMQPFEITKKYANQLSIKMDVFKNVTRTKKQIFFVMISANGLKKNMYSEMIDGVVTLADLFKDE